MPKYVAAGGLFKVAESAKHMTPEELLAITPEFLAKAILHRRERLALEIPEQLDARTNELTEAAAMARVAKDQRDSVNNKVSSLKRERNEAQQRPNSSSLKPIQYVKMHRRQKVVVNLNLNGQRSDYNNASMHLISHSRQTGAHTSTSEQRSTR